MDDTRTVSPDLYREQRYREGKFVCDICLMLWPMSHQIAMSGGLRVGRFCCYEPDGDSVDRDLRRAYASRQAARISAQRAMPPTAPDGVAYSGITELAADSYVTLIDPRPVVLSRGGAAVAVVLEGQGFSATDDIEYGHAGITDATAPSLISDTEWNLSVQASADTPQGRYTFTFNDSVWQAVFDVR